jgi:hypothetical protein
MPFRDHKSGQVTCKSELKITQGLDLVNPFLIGGWSLFSEPEVACKVALDMIGFSALGWGVVCRAGVPLSFLEQEAVVSASEQPLL